MDKSYKIFDKEEELKLVKNRYKNLEGKIPFTIKRLNSSSWFKTEILPKLRKKYPDWIIYSGIWSLTYNYRTNLDKNAPYDDWKKRIMEKMREVEKEDDIEVPIKEYNLENIHRMIDFNVLAYLKGKGFEIRRLTPNIEKIKEFVSKRYKYFALDIKHKDWFS